MFSCLSHALFKNQIDQVPSTFIGMAIFKKCKNINRRCDETTLRKAIKKC